MGLLPVLLCPHYLKEKRDDSFKAMVKQIGGWGIALDDCTALQLDGDKIRFINSNPDAKSYLVKKEKGEIIETAFEMNKWMKATTVFAG